MHLLSPFSLNLPLYEHKKTSLVFNTTYISLDLAHFEIFTAKVGKGGINDLIRMFM